MEKPTYSLTRSYSKKIQIKQYEPIDIFESRSYQWFDKYPTATEIQEKSDELFNQCYTDVEKQANNMLTEKEFMATHQGDNMTTGEKTDIFE